MVSVEYYLRHRETCEAFDTGLGQRETGSCGEMVNVNLNRGGNVIISKSLSTGGSGCRRPLYILSVSGRETGAWLPIPSGGFVSFAAKFSEHMQAHKGVENWGICLADMAKVNEVLLPFGRREEGRGRQRWSGGPVRTSWILLLHPLEEAWAEGRERWLLLNEMHTDRFTHCHGFNQPLIIPSQK